ncbi:hypothetical protein D3880_21140 [Pseudomonas cavernae]|uniref:Uncharacterized protein n=1 Tax=Pseudomonas cavernae TaxID=2320867 RepID=A0A385Z7F8_9PSED|nr:hypothetical protein D3880_21140 [Pseudomonas cavernae]
MQPPIRSTGDHRPTVGNRAEIAPIRRAVPLLQTAAGTEVPCQQPQWRVSEGGCTPAPANSCATSAASKA